ncbi:MAG: tetratricopeptide repeat protein [Myxococcota bacterium]
MSKRSVFTPRIDFRALLVAPLVALACSGNPDRQTLAGLRSVEPDLAEVTVSDGIDQAMAGYRQFLAEAPTSALTPEAMRRLADLELEKEYGTAGDERPRTIATGRVPIPVAVPPDAVAALPSPATSPAVPAAAPSPDASPGRTGAAPSDGESLRAFEARASGPNDVDYADAPDALALPGAAMTAPSGPLEALALYDQILARYPDYAHADQVLYQKARALDELGRVDEAIEVSALLVEKHPSSRHLDEVQFRRGEYFFTRKKWIEAEGAYSAIATFGARSEYFELALYKLGWTFYKQMLLPEALRSYVTLLDHKVASEYDFDQTADEANAQRIADSYRVMSLCFSDLGGAEAVRSFFDETGPRPYENRVYRHLAEFYFEKLRYQDAADTYEAFVARYPLHASSPHYAMRVVEIYQAGDFPKLVLEAKKSFASRYALDSEYWRHFDPAKSPEVVAYLKRNLEDLANHYHALYQESETPEERSEAFAESASWYRRFLASFPDAPETPGIHYRLADLLLENEAFGPAAAEYERIAYGYPAHDRSAAAGYAAIFAHRKHQERAPESEREAIRREAVASTVRFVDHFPDHEHAATVLSVAVQDLFDLHEYPRAIELGRRLNAAYPNADVALRRSAWLVVAHASFEIEEFAPAEEAYGEVLELTGDGDASRPEIVNNLAASIYKQGERANTAGDFRGAADHYLRIAKVAPDSEIRPIAEYDAGAALMKLEDWSGALAVLESFRDAHPTHDLHEEATRQVAFVYRKTGNSGKAAEEYERVAREATDPALRAESLLVAGEMYEEAQAPGKALAAYRAYVSEFTTPIEPAVVTRFKMAELYLETHDDENRRETLRTIVSIDRAAGPERTDTVRGLAARSALLLCEDDFRAYDAIALTQPFERSLQEKQRRMNELMTALGALVDYQVGEVTAAAAYYLAEVYADFSASLLDSERPTDLGTSDLADYEATLEEEAFPFEEKAIRVHEKNLELMAGGVYNPWIEKSLARLAVLMPGRYAKPEESTGPLAALDVYTYRSPAAALAPAPTAETTAAVPVAGTAAVAEPAADPAAEANAQADSDGPEADPSGGPLAAEPEATPMPPASPAPELGADEALLQEEASDAAN